MEPNTGQGACQALENGVALGAIARRVVPSDILLELEKARLRRIFEIHAQHLDFAPHGSWTLGSAACATRRPLSLSGFPSIGHRTIDAHDARLSLSETR
jgi:hypothetical protein